MFGFGLGENFNEYVIGEGWFLVDVWQSVFVEVIEIICELYIGEFVIYDGEYFCVDLVCIWDVLEGGVLIGVVVLGEKLVEVFVLLVDYFIQVEFDGEFVCFWNEKYDGVLCLIGQLLICWDFDRDVVVVCVYDQFCWFGGGWLVNVDFLILVGFEGVLKFVWFEDVVGVIVCGFDLDEFVVSVQFFLDVGFIDIVFVQIGDEGQDCFLVEVVGLLFECVWVFVVNVCG